MTDECRVDPETMALTFSEHVADTEPDPDGYLRRFLDELLVLEPNLRQRFSDALLTDLKEEIARREDPKHSHATVELIGLIEQDWRNDD